MEKCTSSNFLANVDKRSHLLDLAGVIVGEPRASSYFTKERFESEGYVGLYSDVLTLDDLHKPRYVDGVLMTFYSIKVKEKDLTLREDVVSLMRLSNTVEEWNANCDKVKQANGGYPDFWYDAIIKSGLQYRVLGMM